MWDRRWTCQGYFSFDFLVFVDFLRFLSGAIFRCPRFSALLSLSRYLLLLVRSTSKDEWACACMYVFAPSMPSSTRDRRALIQTGLQWWLLNLGWYSQFKCVRIFSQTHWKYISHEFHNSHLKWLRNFGVYAKTAMVRNTHKLVGRRAVCECSQLSVRTDGFFFFERTKQFFRLHFARQSRKCNYFIPLFGGPSEVALRGVDFCSASLYNALARSTQLKC